MRFRSEKDIYAYLMSYCTLFCLTKNLKLTGFFNYGGKELRYAKTCISGPETHVYAGLMSSPPCLNKKLGILKFLVGKKLGPAIFLTKNFKIIGFFLNYGGEDLRNTKTCVSGPETHVNARLRCFPPYFDRTPIYKLIGFSIKLWCRKTSDLRKRAFQGLKRTFMHV